MRMYFGWSFAFAGALAVLAAAPARAVDIQAGPIFNNMDAQNKCPNVCQRGGGGTWDGNWKTTEPGRMSVCSCGGGRQSPVIGAGSSCNARGRGGCSGCSVQCAPGQHASCREGSTWNDKLGNGDQGCVTGSQCTCS